MAEKLSFIEETELIENVVVEANPDEAYARGSVDINFFASLALPEVMLFALPSFYLICFQLLVTRKDADKDKILRFALGLPRGHAKTTFIKIIIAWLIAYDKIQYALVVAATSPNAENIISDINSIMGSPNMEAVYGSWHSNLFVNNSDTKRCMYHGRTVTLKANGAQTAVRGINIDNRRPDLILCDDMQTKENDASPTESKALLTWFVATLLKCIDTRGNRLIIYIGNMYSSECILKKLQESPVWTSLITGAILENGEPLWPELHSIESLMESFYHDESLGQTESWFAEVMNDPSNSFRTLLPNPIPLSDQEEIVADDGAFITVDPAGFRVSSDDNVIVVFKKFNNKAYAVDFSKDIIDPAELIRRTISFALKYGVTLIGIEAVAYQQTLCFWVSFFMRKLNITHIKVVELSPHGRSKEARIRQYIAEMYEGFYVIQCPILRREYAWQASLYKIGGKKNRDDLLDAVAYASDIRNQYWGYITPLIGYDAVDQTKCSVVSNNIF